MKLHCVFTFYHDYHIKEKVMGTAAKTRKLARDALAEGDPSKCSHLFLKLFFIVRMDWTYGRTGRTALDGRIGRTGWTDGVDGRMGRTDWTDWTLLFLGFGPIKLIMQMLPNSSDV